MTVFTPYRGRSIRCWDVRRCGDWRLKVYGLTARGEALPARALAAALAQLKDWLPASLAADTPGVGFLILHTSDEAQLSLLNWWTLTSRLHQRAFRSRLDTPEHFEAYPVEHGALGIAELAVLCFERQAWIDTVSAAAAPNLDHYLAWTVNVDV